MIHRVNERLVNNNPREAASMIQPVEPSVPADRQGEKIGGKLKAPAAYKLNRELENHVAVFEAEGFSEARAGEYMSKVMGFTVTASHIHTAKVATGLTWKSRPKKRKGAAAGEQKGKRARVHRMIGVVIRGLYAELNALRKELDLKPVDVPLEVHGLIRGDLLYSEAKLDDLAGADRQGP